MEVRIYQNENSSCSPPLVNIVLYLAGTHPWPLREQEGTFLVLLITNSGLYLIQERSNECSKIVASRVKKSTLWFCELKFLMVPKIFLSSG